MKSKLSVTLKGALEQKGWTASELSRRSGVSKQNISSWLMNKDPRSLSDLKKVAVVLGLDGGIDELLFGTADKPHTKETPSKGTPIFGEFFDEDGNLFRGKFSVSLVIKKLKE